MQAGLNYDINRELCERVASIYNFLFSKLVEATVQRDVEAVDDALRVLRIERETWQILVDKVNKVREPQDGDDPDGVTVEDQDASERFSAQG